MTPTARSLELLRSRGWIVDKTEYWNAFAKIRKDLFGFIDILCLRDGAIMGVQVTTASNMSARKKKILSLPTYQAVCKAGIGVRIHGWKLNKRRWECREIVL